MWLGHLRVGSTSVFDENTVRTTSAAIGSGKYILSSSFCQTHLIKLGPALMPVQSSSQQALTMSIETEIAHPYTVVKAQAISMAAASFLAFVTRGC